jgi:membrane protein implicated in regulation of membrane protease activity
MSLRSRISDLAHKIDVHKAKTAASLGAGLFALLLAAGAGYDLIEGKSAAWSMVGVTRSTLTLIAIALAFTGVLLLTIGLLRVKRRDTSRDIELDKMEQEYADLLEVKGQNE